MPFVIGWPLARSNTCAEFGPPADATDHSAIVAADLGARSG
jgi:hypothetical protein